MLQGRKGLRQTVECWCDDDRVRGVNKSAICCPRHVASYVFVYTWPSYLECPG